MAYNKIFILFLIPTIFLLISCGEPEQGVITPEMRDGKPVYEPGDVIGISSQADFLGLLRHISDSPITHVGMVYTSGTDPDILEAVSGGVEVNSFSSFLSRGEPGTVRVMRIKPEYRKYLSSVISEAEKYIGTPYDRLFMPGTDKIYCSELIYLSFLDGADVYAGRMIPMKKILGFQKYNPLIRSYISKHWGEIPEDVDMVTPASVMRSGYFDILSE